MSSAVEVDGLESLRENQKKDTFRRVHSALQELQAAGSAISFYSVAERAQVSRSTLYRRRDLKALVIQARDEHVEANEIARQNNSPLLARLEAAQNELLALRAENELLAEALCDKERDCSAAFEYAVVAFGCAA